LRARTPFTARRIASSAEFGPMAAPVGALLAGIEFRSAVAAGAPAAQQTSSTAKTLRMRRFSVIRRSGGTVTNSVEDAKLRTIRTL
jgi:hypothetical protein